MQKIVNILLQEHSLLIIVHFIRARSLLFAANGALVKLHYA